MALVSRAWGYLAKLKSEISERGTLENSGSAVKALIAVLGILLVLHQDQTAKTLADGQAAQTENLHRQSMENEAARSGYSDIAGIILNSDSPVHAKVAALRLIPIAWRAGVTGPVSEQGRRSYPAARTLKVLLTEFVKQPRGEDPMTESGKLELEDLSTKILSLLHKLGPEKEGLPCLWEFPPEEQDSAVGNAPKLRGQEKGTAHKFDLRHLDPQFFTRINLPFALVSQKTIIHFPEGAKFGRANLRGANLRGAILTGAEFPQADLRDADFRGAILDGVDWKDSIRDGAIFDEGVNFGPDGLWTSAEFSLVLAQYHPLSHANCGLEKILPRLL